MVSYAKLVCYSGKTGIRSPHLHSVNYGRCEQVGIYPADAASVQVPSTNELDDLVMRNHPCLVHPFIVRKRLLAPSPITNQELP